MKSYRNIWPLKLTILLFCLAGCGQDEERPSEKTVMLPGDVSLELKLIPAGTFVMGSAQNEKDRHDDEGPERQVTISRPFYMGIYELTQGQWAAVTGENPSVFKDQPNFREYPVDMVSWQDCQVFFEKLNGLGLGKFRLPTEAEWEYACRAGTSARYYWGDDLHYDSVNVHGWHYSRSEGRSQPVGSKTSNPWGLYDMSGNVWEWCSDWKSPYPATDQTDPEGPPSGEERIFRSGSWFNKAATLRSANRNAHVPGQPYTNIGLRVVMETN